MLEINNKKIELLLKKYKEISLLSKINTVLSWDLNVNLPQDAAEDRAGQIAYITKLVAEKWLDPEFKKLLSEVDGIKKLTEEEKAVVRNLNHAGKYYFKVPKEIIIEFAETTSKSFMVWQEAKDKNSFKDFLPDLKKIIKLNQIIAKHLGYKENPYDALLNIYEPGLTVDECELIFKEITPKLTALVKRIKKSKAYKEQNTISLQNKEFPIDDQGQIANFVLNKIGYDLKAGRMDVSSHPFTETLGGKDVRITNRYKTNNFIESIMVALHEGGHALYEQGVKEEYSGTPLEGGTSLGIHESQSRFWENQIGRSAEFIKFLTPVLHAFYPRQLSESGTETFYKMFNSVNPSLIRVEADEVTYNLHIALRFELENALINEKIKPEDLPLIWKNKMKKYLGIVPESDREGVLQDVHWAYGNFGYFPTYTLGNLYAAQITETMKKEIDVERLSEKGEFGTILSWLRTNIHQYGSLYLPKELIKKVTGKKLDSKYFIDYIYKKYKTIYGI